MNIEESRKFIEDKCPHLDNERQEIGFYEMCCLMESYRQYKLKSDLLNHVSHYYLKNGDTINKGDEFQSEDQKWRVTGQGNKVFTSNNHYRHRRRN